MKTRLTLEAVCSPSEDVVAREIEGEIIIVPLVSGIGDEDDELFSLNETGKAIWRLLDGKRTLRCVLRELGNEFTLPGGEIERDVLGFAEELLKRRMLVEISGT